MQSGPACGHNAPDGWTSWLCPRCYCIKEINYRRYDLKHQPGFRDEAKALREIAELEERVKELDAREPS